MSFQYSSPLSTNTAFTIPFQSLLSFVPLTNIVRNHISQVYSTLASMMIVTCSTIYLDLGSRLFPWLISSPWLSILSLVAIMFAFQLTPPTKDNLFVRQALLFSFAAIKGMYLSPLLTTLGFISHRIVPQAVISTFFLFTSFSLAAMYARRRTVLYTLGALGTLSAVSIMVSLSRWLLGIQFPLTFELMLGLVIASIYVILDTQVMIHRASQSNLMDPVSRQHLRLDNAAELYVDLIQVFVHIAMALTNREVNRDEGEGNERRDKTRQR